MVRFAKMRIHPHDLWRQGALDEDRKRPSVSAIARRLGISQGHLSSIYRGTFAPSEDVAGKMAEITNGACSKREILEWHRKNPPVWKRDSAIRKAVEDRRRRASRKVASSGVTELPEDPGKVH